MLRIAVLTLCLIAAGVTTLAAPKETGEFSYGWEGLGRIEVIKSDYGDDPLPAIRAVLTDPETSAASYRRAAAATAFLGADGLKLLTEQLKPMLAAQHYGPKAEACLRTLKYIQDPQSVEMSLAVLESASAPVAFKVMAADNLTPLINRSQAGSGWRFYSKPDGSSGVVSTSPLVYNSREPAYSRVKPVDRTCLLATKQGIGRALFAVRTPRLGNVLSSGIGEEEKRYIYRTLVSVLHTIERKLEEAKDDTPLPEKSEWPCADSVLKSVP